MHQCTHITTTQVSHLQSWAAYDQEFGDKPASTGATRLLNLRDGDEVR